LNLLNHLEVEVVLDLVEELVGFEDLVILSQGEELYVEDI
jgi:hypothetical protein